MSDAQVIVCANCKGKGHVLDAVAAVMMPVLGWVLAPFERNDPDGITRQRCTLCKGRGYIRLEKQ